MEGLEKCQLFGFTFSDACRAPVGSNTPLEVCKMVGWVFFFFFFESWVSALASVSSLLVHWNVVPISMLCWVHCRLYIWWSWHLCPFLGHLCPFLVWLKENSSRMRQASMFMVAFLFLSERISCNCVQLDSFSFSAYLLRVHLSCSERKRACHIFRYWCNKNDTVLVWNWDKSFC